MPTNGLFRDTIALLERSLNLRSLQHRVLASNIANMDTPNYKAVELAVAEEMSGKQSSASGIQLVRTQRQDTVHGLVCFGRVKLSRCRRRI